MSCLACGARARFTSGHGGPLVCGVVCQARIACGAHPLDDMNEDVFALMTTFLSTEDIFALTLTDKRLSDFLRNHSLVWKGRTLTVKDTFSVAQVIVGLAAMGKYITGLRLDRMAPDALPTPDELAVILDAGHGPHITLLNCHRGMTDAHVAILAATNRLVHVHLDTNTHITDASLPVLSAMVTLETLTLSWCEQLSSAALAALAALPRLNHLDLAWCVRVDDTCLVALSAAPALKILYLGECPLITDEGVKALAAAPGLELLELSKCKLIGRPGILALAWAPKLRKLYLGGLDGAAVKDLRKMRPTLDIVW